MGQRGRATTATAEAALPHRWVGAQGFMHNGAVLEPIEPIFFLGARREKNSRTSSFSANDYDIDTAPCLAQTAY